MFKCCFQAKENECRRVAEWIMVLSVRGIQTHKPSEKMVQNIPRQEEVDYSQYSIFVFIFTSISEDFTISNQKDSKAWI